MPQDDIIETPNSEASSARSRPQPEQTNWGALPEELQVEIIRHLIDVRDVSGTLNDVASLLQTSRDLNRVVSGEIDNEGIRGIRQDVGDNSVVVENIPLGNADLGRGTSAKALRLAALTADADFLSLKTAAERRSIVAGVLGNQELPGDAVRNLVRNIDYCSPDDRGRIVDYVCANNENRHARRLLPDLIDKAALLRQTQISRLVETSCMLGEDEMDTERRARLDYWAAGKMKLLAEVPQSQILSVIKADEAGRGRSLAYFAEHLRDLSEKNRSDVAGEILALPAETECKWAGMSYLAEHLPSLDTIDQKTVTSHIVNHCRKELVEDIDDEQDWHSRPEFCRIEAIHQLSRHPKLLTNDQQATVESFIDEIVSRDGEDAEQAQLLPHLLAEKRESFVGEAIQEHTDGVVYGLTARLQDMNATEKEEYLAHLDDHNLLMNSAEHYEVVDYNICNNLEYFTPEQRSTLVDRRLEVAKAEDLMNAGPAFADIARKGAHLRIQDVVATIENASGLVHDNMDEMPTDAARIGSIRSIAGSAARCLANWGGQAIVNSWPNREYPATHQSTVSELDREPTDDESHHRGTSSPRRREGRANSHTASLDSDDEGSGSRFDGAGRGDTRGRGPSGAEELSDTGSEIQYLETRISARPQDKSAADAIIVTDSDDEIMADLSTAPSISRRPLKRSLGQLEEASDGRPGTSAATEIPPGKRVKIDERGDRGDRSRSVDFDL